MVTEKPAVEKRLIFISGEESNSDGGPLPLLSLLAIQSLSLMPIARHRHKWTYLDCRTTANVDGNDRVGSSPLCPHLCMAATYFPNRGTSLCLNLGGLLPCSHA